MPEGTVGPEASGPSPILQVKTIAKYEFISYFASRRFFALLAIVVAIAVGTSGAAALEGVSSFGTTPLAFYSTWYLGGVSSTYVVVFCAIFFGGDSISGEFQNKSGFFLVGNPVGRASIYAGKYLAAVIASAIILAIYTAIALANGFFYFGTVPSQLVESVVFASVFLLAALGLTFFFSSLFKSSSTSILVASILMIFGFFIISAIVGGTGGIEPWFSLTYGSDIIGEILNPAGYPVHVVAAASGKMVFNATIPEGLVIMAAYLLATLVAGYALFAMKEFSS